MKRRMAWAMTVSVILMAVGFVMGQEERKPAGAPEDYPELISWFGHSRSEPIWDGYLFIEGRYVDVPYVVEQRGREIFVNGHRVMATLEDEKLFLTPFDLPLHEEPPPPKVPKDVMSIMQIDMHADVRRMQQYWRTEEITTIEAIQRYMLFLRSLPQVENVIDEGLVEGWYRYRIRFRNGQEIVTRAIPDGRLKLNSLPPRRYFQEEIMREWMNAQRQLRSGNMMIVHPASRPGGWDFDYRRVGYLKSSGSDYQPQPTHEWRVRFKRMETDEEAARKMLASPILVPTRQFWRRLAGDDGWRADAVKPEGPFGVFLKEPTYGDQGFPRPPPPPAPRELTREELEILGEKRSEPIWNGLVFVDGWYIDAPYVVERRGQEALINGYRFFHLDAEGRDLPREEIIIGSRRLDRALEEAWKPMQENLANGALVVIDGGTVRKNTKSGNGSGQFGLFGMVSRLDFEIHHWKRGIHPEGSTAEDYLREMRYPGLFHPDEENPDRPPPPKGWYGKFVEDIRLSPQFWRRWADDPNWKSPNRLE